MTVRVGCSGFIYEHWRGRFYGPGTRGTELEAYARAFDTVELNVTFYRMPSSATFRAWARRVPDDFVFAVKASRYITHIRRLREVRESVDFLMERATELGDHLGPILLQLPPDLEVDPDNLLATLDGFPAGIRVALEPRHPSWFVDEVEAILEDRNIALCLADRRGPVTPLWHPADWSYLRFHGGGGAPRSCYSMAALGAWAGRVAAAWADDPVDYVYFNNDFNACALRDARRFATLLAERGLDPSRIPAIDDDVAEGPAIRRRSPPAA